jgi:hypothetical protein
MLGSLGRKVHEEAGRSRKLYLVQRTVFLIAHAGDGLLDDLDHPENHSVGGL